MQFARNFGAHVIGVCSARNAELVRSLGAERTIDYAKEDFTDSSTRYDLIFDLAGNDSFSACKRVLTPQGIHVGGGGILDGPTSMLAMFGSLLTTLVQSQFSRQKFNTFMTKTNREDLTLIGAFWRTASSSRSLRRDTGSTKSRRRCDIRERGGRGESL